MLPQGKPTVTTWSRSQIFCNTNSSETSKVGLHFGPEGVRMEVLPREKEVIVHAPDHGVKKVLSSGRAAAPSPPEQEAAGSRQKENEARPSLRHGCHSSPSLPALHYCSLLLPASSMIFY